jgi:predicted tellurium resistance membrane protein TerC
MKNVKDRRRPLFWGIFLTLRLRGFSAFSFFSSIDIYLYIIYIYTIYIYYLYIITKKREAKGKRLREQGDLMSKKLGEKRGV